MLDGPCMNPTGDPGRKNVSDWSVYMQILRFCILLMSTPPLEPEVGLASRSAPHDNYEANSVLGTDARITLNLNISAAVPLDARAAEPLAAEPPSHLLVKGTRAVQTSRLPRSC